MAKRRATDLEVARAFHHNENLRGSSEPAELSYDEVLTLFEDTRPDIEVTEEIYAPYTLWIATFGGYDLDCTYGEGRTPLDAIVDLLDKVED